ncbi:MAG: flagellar basal body P-ring protein FlgI [candidate division Zixibacteria bacterium]|jgi:flagellar P-ring protein precursor FlgI|nr:flagellar basal body P-ring protein FlgI [candidate division Zixibacteria bacterium]
MFAALYSRLVIPIGIPLVIAIVLLLAPSVDGSKVRIKDICTFQDNQEADLIGYGLVIGLDGTGDGNGTQFTTQSLVNMMERMGLTVDRNKVKVKNIAAVMVTARLSSQYTTGSYVDVTVSSLGDASSLQGGTLLLTQLSDPGGTVRATAQGPVSIGGFNVQVDDGNKIVNNYTLVGRVPNGGRIVNPITATPGSEKELHLSLHYPDATTSHRVAERINIKYGLVAYPVDGGTIRVVVPDTLTYPTLRMRFISDIGHLEVVPDQAAKVVINEKTGTIVAGQFVKIEPVAIAHGTITVSIQSRPIISQPSPFSDGETVVTSEPSISVQQDVARVVQLDAAVYLSDVANALNRIGATPRDIVAIFQALKQAGALQADLVIM